MSSLKTTDPQVYKFIKGEEQRQKLGMELIASENYVSPSVLEALGSVFTNKYSEGYPGRRYYGGQEFTDAVESLAIERAKKLFRCDHANVQPLSGAPANIAVYFAWLEPGDTVLGMDLTHGGHLTHGSPVTHMAKLFNFVRYKMKDVETGEIDYDELRKVARKEKPKIILAGFSAYPREPDYAKMKAIADEVGAITMADMAHIAGLIVAGVLKNPFDFGFNIITTTTHKTLRGPRGGMILSMGKVSNPLKAVEKTVENLPTLIDRSVFPGFQGGPHMNNTAAKAVAFGEAMKPSFKVYARQIVKNAKAMADELMKQGCKLITNGTDNHLMVMDCIKSFGIDGKEVEQILDKIGITTSKSTVPDDPLPPFAPSGLRLGTPAMTTRGMKEKHMRQIAKWVVDAAHERKNSKVLKKLKKEVVEMSLQFPVPGIK
ncbi:serine hydroxymethyltransferase [Candidatus Daviesbacteria bacterium RIFCSPLOWO2_01_FULL_38_10]|uniref:Serine hydroxymethyltransferase n=1 Tax=Candidatus Daviesbacteria bacterium GW2011_GWF2_38_6 TaxID=1618432 RepID=A0A0G0KHB4_9BACT|nr:MAG: Serine hydroxymethyltransferase [Candidatus Daviesbacteria bacterium GW2011_GWA2_38_17]KKQ79023.1 MAG: Serine hydroxymethyltransferase [Candidatus Daviesbacteria bacterium GW2011_GWF2_38_6]OGE26070.1 MAG: serine hydroxymethyltransferase [Candidatus Daviesbacteria bacterium RIFCSPHIGHO2_02_FULL_39_41]OGE40319.1 MAG: serine hydroxymethyltransferase [Candidatus Daviesbacteria bacterium RIFCSPLOWO2_01_FULL_38_10]OGE44882.1 MAG: serine hydroxymethyltransferase [Candidatus Daviesbacteria bact